MATDLSNLLSKKADEIEKPKPLPVGHYGWLVGAYKAVTSAKKGTPGLEFEVTPFEAKDDVDQELLAEVKEPFKRARRLTFWLTEDSLYRLVDFLRILGIDTEGKEIVEILPDTQSTQFIAPIKHEMGDNGEVFPRLDDSKLSAYE